MTKIKNIFFVAILLFTFQSCNKTNTDSIGDGQSTLKVKLSVGSPEEEKISYGKNNTSRRAPESNVQLSNVQINDNINMEVMVIKDVEPSSITGSTSSSSGARAATQTIKTTLNPGVKYRIMVYNSAGVHQGNFDYIYGSEVSTPGITLNSGETYTFIAYSVNSTSILPDVTNQNLLSNANLNNISSDLMFFKKTMKLSHGDNFLDVVLVHQFSQITTTVQMDDSMTGSIESISGTQITPTKANGSLKLSTGALSFSNGVINSNVTFPAIVPGARSITSLPTFMISPSTTNASFKFGSITLDAENSLNITVPDIKITPGHKYNLVLNFRTCTQNVTSDGLDWRYPEVSWKEWTWEGQKTFYGIKKGNKYYKNNEIIENTFSAPQANYGFQFDITELDNAFNMKVNGKYIFGSSGNDQIQFQTNNNLGTVRNIQFIDGTEYAVNGIDEVYNLNGTATKPLIRIMISRTGEITMLGSKTNGGDLIPLKLKNNQKFKTDVTWNSTGANEVVVSQKVDGRTFVIGNGYGRKRIACPKK